MPHQINERDRSVTDMWMRVNGRPVPGGSKTSKVVTRGGEIVWVPTPKGKRRPLVTTRDDAKGNREWKALVAHCGRNARGQVTDGPVFPDGPLVIVAQFVMPRPKKHAKTEWHLVKPDATKLLRAAEDALTGIWWRDDSQIVRQFVSKRYVQTGEVPGMEIRAMTAEFFRTFKGFVPLAYPAN